MDTKPRLTKWAEISQIASVPLAVIAIALTALAILQAMNKWPGWLAMPSGETIAYLFNLVLALLGATLAFSIWGLRRRLDGHIDNLDSLDGRLTHMESQWTDLKATADRANDLPSVARPDLKLSLLGGNVFVPGLPDMRERFTGIALNVRVRNAGAPSIAVDWRLFVVPQGGSPVQAQLTQIPEVLRLGGEFNSVVVRSSDDLHVTAARDPIPTGRAMEGTLLFYVPLPKPVVDAPSTRLELSVRDINGSESVATQLQSDWVHR